MNRSSFEDRLDDLAATAIGLVEDIRHDRPAAHRTLDAMSHLELRQVACTLAAMVDPSVPLNVMAWWRLDLPVQRTAEPDQKAVAA